MSKRLGKDLRNKFLKEYEQNPEKELSDPNYYILKDKNGKLQVRRKKMKKSDEETSPEEIKEPEGQPKPEEMHMKTTHKEKTL